MQLVLPTIRYLVLLALIVVLKVLNLSLSALLVMAAMPVRFME